MAFLDPAAIECLVQQFYGGVLHGLPEIVIVDGQTTLGIIVAMKHEGLTRIIQRLLSLLQPFLGILVYFIELVSHILLNDIKLLKL